MAAKNSKRLWTPEQEEFLLESYGIAGIQYIMDRLGRSAESIRHKMKELTGSQNIRESVGTFSAREIADVLGVDNKTILTWIETRKFPARQLYKLRKDTKRRAYMIEPENVWKWAAKNKERINFLNVKRGILIPEPKWLNDEVKQARLKPLKQPTNWTREEDEAAWFMWQSGKNHREIAAALNRSENGTQRRLGYLRKLKGVKHKKVSTMRSDMWTKEEEQSALTWRDEGIHYKEIAKRLNRPEKGTCAKINRLLKKKIQEKQNK